MSMETSDADLAFRNIQITYGLISLSASIIVLYEYAVTLPQEVEAVWKREWTATSILLLTIRWTMVTLGVCYVLQPLQYSDTSCSIRGRIRQYASVLGWLEVDLFIALRMFAIWNYNRLIFASISILGAAPVIANAMSASILRPAWSPLHPGCFYTLVHAIPNFQYKYMISAYVTRSSLILQDVVVLCLTWIKTLRQWRVARRANLFVSVSTCLLRDGTIYFITCIILNITQLATFRASHEELLSGFLSVMPLILTNRFMLNLRQLRTRADADAELPWTQYSTIAFNPAATALVGNIGQFLELELDDESEVFARREWFELDDMSVIDIRRDEAGGGSNDDFHV